MPDKPWNVCGTNVGFSKDQNNDTGCWASKGNIDLPVKNLDIPPDLLEKKRVYVAWRDNRDILKSHWLINKYEERFTLSRSKGTKFTKNHQQEIEKIL